MALIDIVKWDGNLGTFAWKFPSDALNLEGRGAGSLKVT